MRMTKDHRIYVAGHRGLAGSAIVQELKSRGYTNLVTKTRQEVDLMDGAAVEELFKAEKPDVVFFAAARVGGIMANNQFRTEFLIENLQIQNNVLIAANKVDVKRLIFLGSSCVYPRACPQPIKEEYLLSSGLEYTNRPYAIAKIAGMELIHALRKQHNRDYFSVMPTNLYGPNDNFSVQDAHVIPGMIRKFAEAHDAGKNKLELFGTGNPKREFMHSHDFASAVVTLAEKVYVDYFEKDEYMAPGFAHINVGTGFDLSIRDLAEKIGSIIGFKGEIVFDPSKPDGTPRKLLDVTAMKKFQTKEPISLDEGLSQTISWYRENRATLRS